MEVGTVHGPHNPSKHGHEDAESTFISPARIPRQIWKGFIQQHYDVSANDTTHG
jgi:hypothetical protein